MDWLPIASAPRSGRIWVWAGQFQDLPGIVSECEWHPDGGFCVDELRTAVAWQPWSDEQPAPPAEPDWCPHLAAARDELERIYAAINRRNRASSSVSAGTEPQDVVDCANSGALGDE